MHDLYVGWICPTFTDYAAAQNFLERPGKQGEWGNGDSQISYIFGTIGLYRVVLVCAGTDESINNTVQLKIDYDIIYHKVRLMMDSLNKERYGPQIFFVGTFGYTSPSSSEPAIGDCVLGRHNFDAGHPAILIAGVPEVCLQNSSILLSAADHLVDSQTGSLTAGLAAGLTTGSIRRGYNPGEPDLARSFCCSNGFNKVPCMSVTGMCGSYTGAKNIEWVPFAAERAAKTISDILLQIGKMV
ncbi:hypothetical protein ACHAQJ_008712 [Trichoderma viride]